MAFAKHQSDLISCGRPKVKRTSETAPTPPGRQNGPDANTFSARVSYTLGPREQYCSARLQLNVPKRSYSEGVWRPLQWKNVRQEVAVGGSTATELNHSALRTRSASASGHDEFHDHIQLRLVVYYRVIAGPSRNIDQGYLMEARGVSSAVLGRLLREHVWLRGKQRPGLDSPSAPVDRRHIGGTRICCAPQQLEKLSQSRVL